jgi:hypothetical protein
VSGFIVIESMPSFASNNAISGYSNGNWLGELSVESEMSTPPKLMEGHEEYQHNYEPYQKIEKKMD